MAEEISTTNQFDLSRQDITPSKMLYLAIKSNNLPELINNWTKLSITSDQPLYQPATIEEVKRIASIVSLDDLNEDDFKSMDSNLTIAKAYATQIGELLGVIKEIDYVGLYEASQRKGEDSDNIVEITSGPQEPKDP